MKEIVQYRFGGVVQQDAAIEERHDLHARRQDLLVQLFHLLVNGHQRLVRVRAFAQQDDAFDHIRVVQNFAVAPPVRLADLTQPDLRPLRDRGDILHAHRRSVQVNPQPIADK